MLLFNIIEMSYKKNIKIKKQIESTESSSSSEESTDNELNKKKIKKEIHAPKRTYEWTKKNKFKKQRIDILNKINKILGISKNNIKLDLNDITQDDMDEIESLQEDIGIYFTSKHISVFSKERKVKRPFLCLIKVVYKEMNWLFQRINKQKDGKNLQIYLVIDMNDY